MLRNYNFNSNTCANKCRLITQLSLLCTLLLVNLNFAEAKIFARGGGESRTIRTITPLRFINTSTQSLTIKGNFSKKQGKDRRVVILPSSPPTAFPVRVRSWNKNQIIVDIPKGLTKGYYHVFLQHVKKSHGRTTWETISNKELFTVISKRIPLRKTFEDSICSGNLLIAFSGGPFKNGNTPLKITAEAKSSKLPAFRSPKPTVKISSESSIQLSVNKCFVLKKGASVRIIYPDHTKSAWISIEQKEPN